MDWKKLFYVFGILVLLVACSSGSEGGEIGKPIDNPSDGVASLDKSEANVNTAEKLLEGGRFVRLYVDPPTLDPHLTTDATSAQVIVEVFGGLVTIDKDLNVVPDLAESWDVSPDGTVYTFRLRRNATFHDGKPVTAEDVRWAL